MSSALGKRKAREEAEERLRLECEQQYGSSSAGSNTATPTTTTLAGSLASSASPLTDDDDESTSLHAETPSEGAPRVVSARRKPKKSGGPPQKGNRGVVNCSKVSDIVKSTGKKIDLDFDWEIINGPRNSDVCSLFVNSLGSIIRKRVAMKKESWYDLDEERKKLFDYLTVSYDNSGTIFLVF